MKTILKTATFAGGILAAMPAFAEERTVILEVSGMTCASCPYIVKQSLADVQGVTAVEVSLAEKAAVVSFDDGKTEVAALIAATGNIGFPSIVKE